MRRKKNFVAFDSMQLNALKVLLGRYRDAMPKVECPQPPILLFTDGACESDLVNC